MHTTLHRIATVYSARIVVIARHITVPTCRRILRPIRARVYSARILIITPCVRCVRTPCRRCAIVYSATVVVVAHHRCVRTSVLCASICCTRILIVARFGLDMPPIVVPHVVRAVAIHPTHTIAGVRIAQQRRGRTPPAIIG
jgi:hypothetical protein